MKRYRLLKDTPTAAAGTICETFGEQGHVIVDPYGVEYDVAKIDNFEEWFEEAKEYKRWRAEKGEIYWFVYSSMNVGSITEINHHLDRDRWMAGNYVKTEKEAELYGKKLVANQKLIDTAKKAWFEFNGSEGPDWSDCGQHKYYVYYNWSVSNKGFHVVDTDSANVFGCIYFPTEESAQAIIDTMKDDLKLIFGVK